MSEYTKGPWRIEAKRDSNGVVKSDDALAICTDDGQLFDVCAVWNDVPDGNAESNANLIAASPLLLEALEDCLDSLGNEFNLPEDVQDAARFAIAKAKGDNQ